MKILVGIVFIHLLACHNAEPWLDNGAELSKTVTELLSIFCVSFDQEAQLNIGDYTEEGLKTELDLGDKTKLIFKAVDGTSSKDQQHSKKFLEMIIEKHTAHDSHMFQKAYPIDENKHANITTIIKDLEMVLKQLKKDKDAYHEAVMLVKKIIEEQAGKMNFSLADEIYSSDNEGLKKSSEYLSTYINSNNQKIMTVTVKEDVDGHFNAFFNVMGNEYAFILPNLAAEHEIEKDVMTIFNDMNQYYSDDILNLSSLEKIIKSSINEFSYCKGIDDVHEPDPNSPSNMLGYEYNIINIFVEEEDESVDASSDNIALEKNNQDSSLTNENASLQGDDSDLTDDSQDSLSKDASTLENEKDNLESEDSHINSYDNQDTDQTDDNIEKQEEDEKVLPVDKEENEAKNEELDDEKRIDPSVIENPESELNENSIPAHDEQEKEVEDSLPIENKSLDHEEQTNDSDVKPEDPEKEQYIEEDMHPDVKDENMNGDVQVSQDLLDKDNNDKDYKEKERDNSFEEEPKTQQPNKEETDLKEDEDNTIEERKLRVTNKLTYEQAAKDLNAKKKKRKRWSSGIDAACEYCDYAREREYSEMWILQQKATPKANNLERQLSERCGLISVDIRAAIFNFHYFSTVHIAFEYEGLYHMELVLSLGNVEKTKIIIKEVLLEIENDIKLKYNTFDSLSDIQKEEAFKDKSREDIVDEFLRRKSLLKEVNIDNIKETIVDTFKSSLTEEEISEFKATNSLAVKNFVLIDIVENKSPNMISVIYHTIDKNKVTSNEEVLVPLGKVIDGWYQFLKSLYRNKHLYQQYIRNARNVKLI